MLYSGWSHNSTNAVDSTGDVSTPAGNSSFPRTSVPSNFYPPPPLPSATPMAPHYPTDQPGPPFSPYGFNSAATKEEFLDLSLGNFLPPLADEDYRRDDFQRAEQRGAPMVLSHPVPDYSVAAGSSPFTLQAQAPHFQPRPRPLFQQSYPPSPMRPPSSDFHQRQDPRSPQQLEWEYQRQDLGLPQPLPQHLNQQAHETDFVPLDQQGRSRQLPARMYSLPAPSSSANSSRLSDILPSAAECGTLFADRHSNSSSTTTQGGMHYLQERDEQQSILRQQHGLQMGHTGEMMNELETELDVDGKKTRKRRRLKGELPRDHALRKYKCGMCSAKFARPSALATHVLTHTREKPFICPTCDRGFAVMSNLRRHCRVRKHQTPPLVSTAPDPPSI